MTIFKEMLQSAGDSSALLSPERLTGLDTSPILSTGIFTVMCRSTRMAHRSGWA